MLRVITLLLIFIVAAPLHAQEMNDEATFGEVVVGRLNVRAAPTTESDILTVIVIGDVFPIIGENETGDWRQIQLTPEQPGWVFAEYFIPTEATEGTPIEPIEAPAQISGETIRVTQDVNVRAGPGTVFDILNGLPGGTTVTVIGRNGDNTWAQVQIPNRRTGWIFDGALPEDFDLAPFPVPESALLAALSQGAPWRVVNTVIVQMGPGIHYPDIGTVRAGEGVQVIGRDTLSQWVKINYPISNGWLPAAAFPAGTNIEILPLSLDE